MRRVLGLLLGFCVFAAAAQAQEVDDPLAKVRLHWEKIEPGVWKTLAPRGGTADVGFEIKYRPNYIGAKRSRFDVLPVLEFKTNDRLSISLDDGIKYAAIKSGPFQTGPLAEYRMTYNDHLPAGAHKMQDTLELGGFASYLTPIGETEFRLRRATNGYQGWSGDLMFGTGGHISPEWLVAADLKYSWADTNYSNTFFGLNKKQSKKFHLPRLLSTDFTTAGTQFTLAHQNTDKTTHYVRLGFDRILHEDFRSPILKTRSVLSVELGMTYHFSGGPAKAMDGKAA